MDKEHQSNGFTATIAELNRGRFVGEVSDKFAELCREVNRLGKRGELTVKLKVEPNTDGETFEVKPFVDAKIPKSDLKPANFYMDENGRLLRDNPRQPELFKSLDGGEQDQDAQSAAR